MTNPPRDAVAPDFDRPALDVHSAALYLGIAERTVRRHVAEGRLGCFRLGDGPHATIRFSWRHIDAFLGRPTPEPEAPRPMFDGSEKPTHRVAERGAEIVASRWTPTGLPHPSEVYRPRDEGGR